MRPTVFSSTLSQSCRHTATACSANFLHISGLPTPAELPEVDGPTCSEDRLEELGTRSMGTVGRIDANQLAGDRIGATDGDNASASDVALACLPALGIR